MDLDVALGEPFTEVRPALSFQSTWASQAYALRSAEWLQRRVSEAETNDPALKPLKNRVNELSEQVRSAAKAERPGLARRLEEAIHALIDHVTKKMKLPSNTTLERIVKCRGRTELAKELRARGRGINAVAERPTRVLGVILDIAILRGHRRIIGSRELGGPRPRHLWRSRFGLPEDVRRTGAGYLLLEKTDETQIAKGESYDRYGKFGVALLVAGFLLQLASNFL